MEFNPNNEVVKRCIEGMAKEEMGQNEEAFALYQQAWKEATTDSEKFIASYYVAKQQKDISEELKWWQECLHWGLEINDDSVKSAFPALYAHIANGYEKLGELDKAQEFKELALSVRNKPADKGPFYHGTRADLKIGDLLVAGGNSNYKDDFKMNHIYFTALKHGAGLAAALAKGNGRERVYIVEPTGSFENDPNVTDKKFPGNPTRSYRSEMPLKIIGEISEWTKLNSEEINKWREKLERNKGEIIN